MSFRGVKDEARELRFFVNALRQVLGLAPLYDLDEVDARANSHYLLTSEIPTQRRWGRSDLFTDDASRL